MEHSYFKNARAINIATLNVTYNEAQANSDRRSPQWHKYMRKVLHSFLRSTQSRGPVGQRDSGYGFYLVSLEEHARNSVGTQSSPTFRLSKGEAYVSSMLSSGRGLACWRPQPQFPLISGEGAVPGDVGIFSVERGFKKIFNLSHANYDPTVRDTAEVGAPPRLRYIFPNDSILVNETELRKGDTFAQGATSRTHYTQDAREASGFEFRYLQPYDKGAILAVTSDARLEELTSIEKSMLHNHICRRAEDIYGHAYGLEPFDDNEDLYIITGCIKSEDWALAGFRDPMFPPDDTLRLVRRPLNSSVRFSQPPYAWTEKGASDAFSGMSEESGSKDQLLFMRGFRLGFSKSFLQRAKSRRSKSASSGGADSEPDLSSPGQGPSGSGGPSQDSDSSRKDSRETSAGASRGNTSLNTQIGARSEAFSRPTLDPCVAINRYLLETMDTDFALSHDNDWIAALEGSPDENHVNAIGGQLLMDDETLRRATLGLVSVINNVAVFRPDPLARTV